MGIQNMMDLSVFTESSVLKSPFQRISETHFMLVVTGKHKFSH